MSKETEEILRNWEKTDEDVGDTLHRHFGEFGRWEWLDVNAEGLRVWNLMFEEAAETFSPIDDLISAVAGQAASGAYAAMAAALGVRADALELAVAEWSEKQDCPPPPAGPEGLMLKVAEYAAEIAADELSADS